MNLKLFKAHYALLLDLPNPQCKEHTTIKR